MASCDSVVIQISDSASPSLAGVGIDCCAASAGSISSTLSSSRCGSCAIVAPCAASVRPASSSGAKACRRRLPLLLTEVIADAGSVPSSLDGSTARFFGVLVLVRRFGVGDACMPASDALSELMLSGTVSGRRGVLLMGVPARRFLPDLGIGVPLDVRRRPRRGCGVEVDGPSTSLDSSSIESLRGTVVVVIFSRRREAGPGLGVGNSLRRVSPSCV